MGASVVLRINWRLRWTLGIGPRSPNKALQLTANALRGLSAVELGR
jgi:hypothetical protein